MKRHTKQSNKQKLGQYFTTNTETLLRNYTHYFKDKDIVDPFAGDCDLLTFATKNGARTIEAHDINPRHPNTSFRDSLVDPPDFNGKFLLTNPPYLSSNKNKIKTVYKIWDMNDYYKCHIASFCSPPSLQEGILILPSNFLSESSSKARDTFFRFYSIKQCDYYYYPVFDDATTGICVFYFEKDQFSLSKNIPIRIHYSETKIVDHVMEIHAKNGWLDGSEFFEFIDVAEPPFSKWTGKEPGILTNMVVGLLDKGAYKQGLTYNDGNPVLTTDTAFTTYQLVSSVSIPEDYQKKIVEEFNNKMDYFRSKYHGLFLSNYMGANQKIYSRSYIHKMIWKIYSDLLT